MSVRTGTTISVCVDCYMAVDGDDNENPDYAPDREPLNLIDENAEVTSGCLDCEPCGHDECAGSARCCCAWDHPGHGFSWSPCQGCGSTLGGDREPLVVWEAS